MACPAGAHWSGSACVADAPVVAEPKPPPPPCAAVADCDERCAKGEAASCTALGLRYDTGQGVDKDDERARQIAARLNVI